MSEDKKVVLNLKTEILNIDGSVAKDSGKETRTKEELGKLSAKQVMDSWPPITVGTLLIGLINSIKPDSIDTLSKYSTMLTKIRNKLETDKGEWHIEKQELLNLQDVFKKADSTTLNVNFHGQAYNIIQDLLIKCV